MGSASVPHPAEYGASARPRPAASSVPVDRRADDGYYRCCGGSAGPATAAPDQHHEPRTAAAAAESARIRAATAAATTATVPSGEQCRANDGPAAAPEYGHVRLPDGGQELQHAVHRCNSGE